jgi:inosose dehydratase
VSDGEASGGGIQARIAAAPISWGVCEVPGWGYQLAPDQVLTEMSDLGFSATEFGPDGFLAEEPQAKADQLASYGMSAVGGFLPILLHDRNHDPMPEVDAFIDACLASGADVVVLAAYSGADGYDSRPVLDDDQWRCLLDNLDRISARAEERGVIACLHPHIGTMIETAEEIDRMMAGSVVGLCVDTGHLAVGGADPVAVTAAYADRVRHVHLKDVDLGQAKQVIAGEVPFGHAVKNGMFRPLGEGDVDIVAMVTTLERAGYDGWYVLEQDVMLDDAEQGAGIRERVRSSRDYLVDATAGEAPSATGKAQ